MEARDALSVLTNASYLMAVLAFAAHERISTDNFMP